MNGWVIFFTLMSIIHWSCVLVDKSILSTIMALLCVIMSGVTYDSNK